MKLVGTLGPARAAFDPEYFYIDEVNRGCSMRSRIRPGSRALCLLTGKA
jgi:hypothetical protein